MSHNSIHALFEKSIVLETPYRLGEDPRPIQIAFGLLLDQAAQAIYLAGSDLDEVLVERTLILRAQGGVYEVPATFLSDAELLRKSVLDHFDENDHDRDKLEISALKIIARHDRLNQA